MLTAFHLKSEWDKTAPVNTFIQHYTGGPGQYNKVKKKEIKDIRIREEEIKRLRFFLDVIIYIGNLKESANKLLRLTPVCQDD